MKDNVTLPIQRLREAVSDLIKLSEDKDIGQELVECNRRLAELRDEVKAFLEQSAADHVYWVERSGKAHKNLALNAAPIDVAEFLRRRLFESDTSIIMTSATLATDVAQTSGSVWAKRAKWFNLFKKNTGRRPVPQPCHSPLLIPSHPRPNQDEISRTGGRKEQLISSRSVWLIPFPQCASNNFSPNVKSGWRFIQNRVWRRKSASITKNLPIALRTGWMRVRARVCCGNRRQPKKWPPLSGILTANDICSDILS